MNRPPTTKLRPVPAIGLAIGLLLGSLPHALGAPADPFALGLPSRDTKPPEGVRSVMENDVSATGAATYSVPLQVPPGRGGMAPSLALGYSSAAPLRGGVAVGWTLDVPVIERDPDYPTELRYRTTLSGSSGKLVRNYQDYGSGERYRAEVDSEQVRYERDPSTGLWTARAPDGTVHTFGLVGVYRWHLTETRDALGNTITYDYARRYYRGHVEYQLRTVEYGANAAAGVPAHAKVELVYENLPELCGGVPVGASLDYHFGAKRMSGSHTLERIDTFVRDTPSSGWRDVQRYVLGYDDEEASCAGSALRYLTSLEHVGFRPDMPVATAPTMYFSYGATTRALSRTLAPSWSPREVGNRFGATTGFMDMNGDGRTDYVEVEAEPTGCELYWYAGLGDGEFAAVASAMHLPSAGWELGWPQEQFERCTLTGQTARRHDISSRNYCAQRSVFVNYHFIDVDGDGALDLLSALSGDLSIVGGDFGLPVAVFADDDDSGGGGCPIGTTQVGAIENGVRNCGCIRAGEQWDAIAGECRTSCPVGQTYDVLSNECTDSDTCYSTVCDEGGGGIDDPGPVCAAPPRNPQVEGLQYVWYLQRNDGGAIEPLSAEGRIYSPRPLPLGGAAQTATLVSPRPDVPALVDINGDGHLDVVSLDRYPRFGQEPPVIGSGDSRGLYVWLGNADLEFPETPVVWAFHQTWGQQLQAVTQTSGPAGELFTAPTTLALRDLNGDGLPDLVVQGVFDGGALALGVAYNMPGSTAGGFFVEPKAGGFSELVMLGSGAVGVARTEATEHLSNGYLVGRRALLRTLLDLDGDGATELVFQTVGDSIASSAVSRVAFRIASEAAYPDWRALGPEWEATEALVEGTGWTWQRASDFLDITGDGLPDALSYGPDGALVVLTDEPNTTASMRMLTAVSRAGGETRFDYAWSNDADVVTPDGRIMPLSRIVSRVTVSPGYGQPDMTTSYHYRDPVRGRRSPLDPTSGGLLGFDEITVDSLNEHGAITRRVVKTYDFEPRASDWGGRLAQQVTSIASAGTGELEPVTHERFEYAAGTLSGSSASFTYRTRTVHRTCVPSLDCATQANNVKTTTETWFPWVPAGSASAQLYLHTRTVESDGASEPRYTRRDYIKWWTATDARIRQTIDERGRVYTFSHVGGTKTLYLPGALTQTVYTAAGLPQETRVYRNGSDYSSTTRTFHPYTGVLLSEKTPKGGYHYFYYEPFMVYLYGHRDPSGATRYETHDMGTGAMLSTTGPNWRFGGPAGYMDDREAWVIDGLGRVVSRHDSIDPAPGVSGYDYREVERITYSPADAQPRRDVSRLRDAAADAWVDTEEHYDGLGRVVRTVARGGAGDAVTDYVYDPTGELRSMTAPSPVGDGHTATTAWERDGLGRATLVVRPDGSMERATYSGLDTDLEEDSTIDGPGARTTLLHNVYGELVEVFEHDNPNDGDLAVTSYRYDPLGRVVLIQDAEGNVTTMGYDWRGLRTSVTRAGRTWIYEYDAHGNMEAETEPVPPGATTADYRSTTSYDPIDRPMTITPASRGLSAGQRARLGIGPTIYSYDGNGHYGKPHLITLPFGSIALTYTATGQVAKETRAITLTSSPHLAALSSTQWVERRYDALGHPTHLRWDDGNEWRYEYDARGAVQNVYWRDPVTTEEVRMAHYDRLIAGQPYRRTSQYSAQERTWEYDVIGRVTYDRVWRTNTGDTLHERVYGYDGHGELRLVEGQTAGMIADTTIEYDARHRVIAATGPMGYEAAFTYSPTGNVLTAMVVGASDTPDRNVSYSYGARDPHAVDRITSLDTGVDLVTYAYDHAGNPTVRSAGWSPQWMTYGTGGLLREVGTYYSSERYLFGPGAERMVSIGLEGVKLWFGESETHFDHSGNFIRRYHHLAAGEPIARIERTTSTSLPIRVELQYADALSNLVLATNGGAIRAAFVYGAFGEIVGATGTADHRRGFNGKEHDLTGFRHYGYRSYDPVSLRWLNGDPKYTFAPESAGAEPQRANRYAFSLNNPLRYVDPDGREPDGEYWVAVITAPVVPIPIIVAGRGATYNAVPGVKQTVVFVKTQTLEGGRVPGSVKVGAGYMGRSSTTHTTVKMRTEVNIAADGSARVQAHSVVPASDDASVVTNSPVLAGVTLESPDLTSVVTYETRGEVYVLTPSLSVAVEPKSATVGGSLELGATPSNTGASGNFAHFMQVNTTKTKPPTSTEPCSDKPCRFEEPAPH